LSTGVLIGQIALVFAIALAGLVVLRAVRRAFGDDHQLARAEELLVQLGVGDVVRVVGEEEGGARRHVAHLQPPAVVWADDEEGDRQRCDRPFDVVRGVRRGNQDGDARRASVLLAQDRVYAPFYELPVLVNRVVAVSGDDRLHRK